MKQYNIPVTWSVSDKVVVEAESLESKPLQFLVRFVLKKKSWAFSLVVLNHLQWNRKRQYAGSKTASDRKRKTSVAPLLWC